MSNFTRQQWKLFIISIVIIDALIVGGIFYLFTATTFATVPTTLPAQIVATGPTPTATIKPWKGPPKVTPSPIRMLEPPTPLPTDVLAESGFPPGFTPTPRPTREPVYISLPQIYPASGGSVDVPIVNQVLYPEPFFAPGTNSACGPVALYAATHGLGIPVDYNRLRDISVQNGFNASGMSTWGMYYTIATLNQELNNPFVIEHNYYRAADLLKHLRQGGVVVALVHVRKENGHYRLTTEGAGSVGHFLLIERVNTRSKKVKLAGSTLGMDEVGLGDFIQSWTNNPEAKYSKTDPSTGWALILKKSQPEN